MTTMTRQDFRFIAEVLAAARAEEGTPANQAVVDRLSERFAESLEATNPRFNYQRFLDAAGYPGGE